MLTLGKKNVPSESSTEKFEKEQQCKPRNTSREIEIKKKNRKYQQRSSLLFEIMRLITQKYCINNRYKVITNAQEVNQIRQNYKLLYADKFESLGQMDNLKI